MPATEKGREDNSQLALNKTIFLLCGFDNGTGPNTPGAGVYPHDLSFIGNRSYFLDIRQPTPTVLVMGMTDVIAGSRTFATDFTLSGHNIFSSQGVFFRKFFIFTIFWVKCKVFPFDIYGPGNKTDGNNKEYWPRNYQ